MDKEHMNEIRRVGKGSLGGKGSRKRHHGGKPSSRRLSEAERLSAETRLAALQKSWVDRYDESDLVSAEKVIKENYGDEIGADDPLTFWTHVRSVSEKRYVIRGDEQYIKAADLVTAIAVKVMASDDAVIHCRLLEEAVAQKARLNSYQPPTNKLTTESDLIRSIARLVIAWPNDSKGQIHPKRLSRFVTAIRNLMTEMNVRPGGIAEYFLKHPGSFIDRWHRSPAARKQDRRVKVEAAAVAMEDEHSSQQEMKASDYWDDENTQASTDWSKADLAQTKVEQRLAKLSGAGRWECQALQFYRREKGIKPCEGMLTLAVGDEDSHVGVRLVDTRSVGPVPLSPELQKALFAHVQAAAKEWLEREHQAGPALSHEKPKVIFVPTQKGAGRKFVCKPTSKTALPKTSQSAMSQPNVQPKFKPR